MNDQPQSDRSGADKNESHASGTLAERIAKARKAHVDDTSNRANGGYENSAFGRGVRLSSEFVAAILVGGGLGYAVDQIFGIAPFGLIVLLLLGFAAGVLNVMRAAAEFNQVDDANQNGSQEGSEKNDAQG